MRLPIYFILLSVFASTQQAYGGDFEVLNFTNASSLEEDYKSPVDSSDLGLLQKKIDSLVSVNNILTGLVNTKADTLAVLRAKINTAVDTIRAKSTQITELVRDTANYRKSIMLKDKEILALEEKVGKKNVNGLKGKVDSLNAILISKGGVEADLARVRSTIALKNDTISSLNQDNANLKISLGRAEGQLRAKQDSLRNLKETTRDVRNFLKKELEAFVGGVKKAEEAASFDELSQTLKSLKTKVDLLSGGVVEDENKYNFTFKVYQDLRSATKAADTASEVLRKSFSTSEVQQKLADIKRVPTSSLSSTLQGELKKLSVLLTNYCQENARVYNDLQQLIDINESDFTREEINILLSGNRLVKKVPDEYTFIRAELYRNLSGNLHRQPFTPSKCQ